MNKHYIALIASSILLTTHSTYAQSHQSIRNSVWIAPVTSTVYDTLWLESNGRYIEYDSELDERYYGRFRVVGDTLLQFQEYGQYDQQEPERGTGKALFKYQLKGDSLNLIYSQPSLAHAPTTHFNSMFTYHRLRP